MKVLIAFTLSLILTTVSTFNLNENKVLPRDRVFNGQEADRFQFPYVVGLNVRSTDFENRWCGGSLISNRWILTAAHCFNNVFEVEVLLGATNHMNYEKKMSLRYPTIFKHDNYSPVIGVHDIALIKIPAIEFSSTIKSINLPTGMESVCTGKKALIAGWGSTVGYVKDSFDTLMWGQTKVINILDCHDIYRDNLPQLVICVEGIRSSICQADSGGPLALQSKNVLIGVAFGNFHGGCEEGKPSIFTSVIHHVGWVQNIMGHN